MQWSTAARQPTVWCSTTILGHNVKLLMKSYYMFRLFMYIQNSLYYFIPCFFTGMCVRAAINLCTRVSAVQAALTYDRLVWCIPTSWDYSGAGECSAGGTHVRSFSLVHSNILRLRWRGWVHAALTYDPLVHSNLLRLRWLKGRSWLRRSPIKSRPKQFPGTENLSSMRLVGLMVTSYFEVNIGCEFISCKTCQNKWIM